MQSNPGLADAIQAGPEQFKRAYESALAQATAEKQRHTEVCPVTRSYCLALLMHKASEID